MHKDWWINTVVIKYVFLESMMNEQVTQENDKCEHGRGDEKYPWFEHPFPSIPGSNMRFPVS